MLCKLFGHKVDCPLFVPPPEQWINPPTTKCPRCHKTVYGYPIGKFKTMFKEIKQEHREKLRQARSRHGVGL